MWARPTLGRPSGEGRCPAEPSCTEELAEDGQPHCMEADFSSSIRVTMAPKGPTGDLTNDQILMLLIKALYVQMQSTLDSDDPVHCIALCR